MIKRFWNYSNLADLKVSVEDLKIFKKNIFKTRFKESRIILVDCRYNYEFNGGHLKNAFNIIDPEVIRELFFNHSWIAHKDFVDYLLTFKDDRIDIEKAKTIKRKYEKKLMMSDNNDIESKLKKMNLKSNTK
jgi:hypothetical protein